MEAASIEGKEMTEAEKDALIRELAEALDTLLDAVNGHHVTEGDCNQARSALAKVPK